MNHSDKINTKIINKICLKRPIISISFHIADFRPLNESMKLIKSNMIFRNVGVGEGGVTKASLV